MKNLEGLIAGTKIKIEDLYTLNDIGYSINDDLYIHKIAKKIPESASLVYVTRSVPDEQGRLPYDTKSYSVPLKHIIKANQNIADFENEILALHKQLKDIQDKLDYMKANGIVDFNQDDYKIFMILSEIKNDQLSDNQIVKRIKEIMVF